MTAFVPRWLPLALIALVALWLRTHDLARRPMHADEANQAVKLGALLESGDYAFDPRDHHGPTLYYAALPIAWLRGQHTLAALDEITVRLVPALAGTLAVVWLGLLAVPLGRLPALAAAAFLAVSPSAVYYSRDFIQETLLLAATLAVFVCARRWGRTGQMGWALAAGAGVGLMQATKASAPLFLVAAALACFVTRPRASGPLPLPPRRWRDLAFALGTALLVTALFYSSFGTHPAGLRDALATYFQSAQRLSGATGHEKPWWYYARLLAWWPDGGLVFQQVAFTALALAGAALAVIPPRTARPAWPHRSNDAALRLLRWGAAYTLLLALVLSLTPYKTPWHVIHLGPGLALLAAGVLAAIPRRTIGVLLAVAVVTMLAAQTRLAVFRRPTDARNPYAYVHSSPDVLKFRTLADAALARAPGGLVRVIGDEYWPLPWYFRGFPRVGYWSAPPADCDGALVVVASTQADAVRARLHGTYRESYLGLRPGFLCVVFTPQR